MILVLTYQCQIACLQLLVTILPFVAQKVVPSFACTTLLLPVEWLGVTFCCKEQTLGRRPRASPRSVFTSANALRGCLLSFNLSVLSIQEPCVWSFMSRCAAW